MAIFLTLMNFLSWLTAFKQSATSGSVFCWVEEVLLDGCLGFESTKIGRPNNFMT
jgi:hypothetical protein